MTEPRILLYDLETAPIHAWTWGPKFQTNIIKPTDFSYLLCFGYKWLGEDDVKVVSQTQFARNYKRNRKDDSQVAKALWHLFDEADITIAHNGNQFDYKVSNARFAYNGLTRPSPFFKIDTKHATKRHFRLPSNSLNDIAQYFDLGAKLQHTGFDLWERCMQGEESAWSMMMEYCEQDVELLERLYLFLRDNGWIDNHPNLANIGGLRFVCPHCGADRDHLQKRGFAHTNTVTYQQYWCRSCNSWPRERLSGKGPAFVSR